MSTNRQRYLHRNLNIKKILLTFLAAVFLSACGIKGDLYQTPEQAVTEPAEQNQAQTVTRLDESKKQQAVQQPIESAVIPSVKQSTDQVKESP
ncbi:MULTISPECIES: LPS translocon maturation chaperone LptM [Colwellia]|nr:MULTISPECIES: lipoprotein [Colwellia]